MLDKLKLGKKKIMAIMCSLSVFAFAMPVGAEEELNASLITELVGVVTDVIALFMEEPLVWFVYLGIIAAGIGIVKGLIPRKRAK